MKPFRLCRLGNAGQSQKGWGTPSLCAGWADPDARAAAFPHAPGESACPDAPRYPILDPMTTRHAAILTASLLAALTGTALTGCASGPSSYAEARAEQAGGRSPGDASFSDEVVVGTLYDDRGVPHYQSRVSALTMDEIAQELLDMRAADEELVRESTEQARLDPAEVARIKEIDRAHATRLSQIIDVIGWPTREQVGVEAAQGAFLVIQHAGHDPELQNRCLTLMVDQVEQGKLPAAYLALLTDRIRLFANQPQVFGTQMTFKTDDNGITRCVAAVPIEDPARLNDRRTLMGMPPHELFVARLEEAYRTQHGGAFASVLTDD